MPHEDFISCMPCLALLWTRQRQCLHPKRQWLLPQAVQGTLLSLVPWCPWDLPVLGASATHTPGDGRFFFQFGVIVGSGKLLLGEKLFLWPCMVKKPLFPDPQRLPYCPQSQSLACSRYQDYLPHTTTSLTSSPCSQETYYPAVWLCPFYTLPPCPPPHCKCPSG